MSDIAIALAICGIAAAVAYGFVNYEVNPVSVCVMKAGSHDERMQCMEKK